MIEIKGLTKRYGSKCAVNHISFTVNQGEILGFLGPNGAGKSTTMNMLTGYLSASEGEVNIAGFDILDNPMEAKRKIGYLPEIPPLYVDMTVDEYLDFMYDLKKVKLDITRKSHISQICELVKITDVRHRVIRNLSKGYKQRVGIAQALLGNPEVLILDEPTVGLDPRQIIEIRALIKNLSERHTVILSSHILPEIQAVCDRVIVINKGRIVADDTETNLSNCMSEEIRFSLRVEGPEADVFGVLEQVPGMKEVQKLGLREEGIFEYSIEAKEGEDIRRAVFAQMSANNWPIMSLKSSELTLEDIFLKLITEDPYQEEIQDVLYHTSENEFDELVDIEQSIEEDGGLKQDLLKQIDDLIDPMEDEGEEVQDVRDGGTQPDDGGEK